MFRKLRCEKFLLAVLNLCAACPNHRCRPDLVFYCAALFFKRNLITGGHLPLAFMATPWDHRLGDPIHGIFALKGAQSVVRICNRFSTLCGKCPNDRCFRAKGMGN